MSLLASLLGQTLANVALGFLRWWSQRHDAMVIERQRWIIAGLALDEKAAAYLATARSNPATGQLGVRDTGARIEFPPGTPGAGGLSGNTVPDPPDHGHD